MRIYPERPVSPQMLPEFVAGGYRPPAPPMFESDCSVGDKRFPPASVPQAEAPPQNPAATPPGARQR
jgi:hypothetical protein